MPDAATIIVILRGMQQLFDAIERLRRHESTPEYLDARDAVRRELVEYANMLASGPEPVTEPAATEPIVSTPIEVWAEPDPVGGMHQDADEDSGIDDDAQFGTDA